MLHACQQLPAAPAALKLLAACMPCAVALQALTCSTNTSQAICFAATSRGNNALAADCTVLNTALSQVRRRSNSLWVVYCRTAMHFAGV